MLTNCKRPTNWIKNDIKEKKMRTINEIIIAVQECEEVTEEELKFTLISLNYWSQMAYNTFVKLSQDPKNTLKVELLTRNEYESYFRMLKQTPDHYLGLRWTPGTEENKKAREFSKKIFKKATSIDLEEKE